MSKNNNNLLISICIPTHNRADLLDECLKSITTQKNYSGQIEVVISDNASVDDTKNIVSKYSKELNIKYYRNSKNIGLVSNVIEVGKNAKGKYIWFLSDDDILKKNAIKTVVNVLDKKPDVIYCNLDFYSNKTKKIIKYNLLKISYDYEFKKRKDFFRFLNKKFIYEIDWFTTFYSNLIISHNLYTNTVGLSKKNKSSLDVFPHVLGILFLKKDYFIYIISKSILFFRGDNRSWGPSQKKEFLKYWDMVLEKHYHSIYETNKNYIPKSFIYKVKIKNIIRKIKLFI